MMAHNSNFVNGSFLALIWCEKAKFLWVCNFWMNSGHLENLYLKKQKRHCRIVEIITKTVHRKVLIHGPAGRRPDFCWGTTPDTGNQGTQIFLAFIGNIFMFPNFLYTHLLTINNDNCTECKVGCSAWQEQELDSRQLKASDTDQRIKRK